MRKRITAVVSASLLLGSLAVASNPGHSHAGGKSLADWIVQYMNWSLGGGQAGQDKNTVFIPIPDGVPSPTDPTILVGAQDFTMHPGQRFVLSVFIYYGESYLEPGVAPDDPADFPNDIFLNSRVLVTLDGKPIIDSTRGNLSDFFVDTQYFDEPIGYDEPVERGPGLNAIEALWIKGLGFVHEPLSKGQHTLELNVYSDDAGFGFINTWHITVAK